MLRVLYSCASFQNYWEETFSTKIDRFSTAVPLLLVIILAGLLFLGVFVIPYTLLGFTSFGLINLFKFSSMALRLIHFSIHVLILSSSIFVGSPFKRVNGLLFIWYWNLILFIVNKTNLEPLSWTLIVWSSKERGSCEDFRSSVERLLQNLW